MNHYNRESEDVNEESDRVNQPKFQDKIKMFQDKGKIDVPHLTKGNLSRRERTLTLDRNTKASSKSFQENDELLAKLAIRKEKNGEVNEVDLRKDVPIRHNPPIPRIKKLTLKRSESCYETDSELIAKLNAMRTKNGETILQSIQDTENNDHSNLQKPPLKEKKNQAEIQQVCPPDKIKMNVQNLTEAQFLTNDTTNIISTKYDDNSLELEDCEIEYAKKVTRFRVGIFPLFEATNLFESVYTFPILSADEFIQSSTKSLKILDFYDNITFFNYKRGFNNISLKKLWDVILKKENHTKSDIRMLMVELDLPVPDKVDFLRTFTKDPRLNSYLQESAKHGTVGIEDIRTMCMEEMVTDDVVLRLKVECSMCCAERPMNSIKNLLACKHEICTKCFKSWLEENIMNKAPGKWNCPMCDDNVKANKQLHYCDLKEFMNNNGCSENIADVFNRKLLNEQLRSSKNFVQCANDQCVYGFEVEGDIKKMKCPICLTNMCVQCKQKWEDAHDNRTCQEYNLWMVNSGARSSKILNCIECPRCNKIYDLIRGGCIHFTCTECSFEFCGWCFNLMTENCQDKKCKSGGLHAHHPRNCLYNLRDYSSNEMENMLKGTNYAVLRNKPEKQCKEMTSSENDKKEKFCSTQVYSSTGLCETHYKEYLARAINQLKVDPAKFVNSRALNLMLMQACRDQLQKLKDETEETFVLRLRKKVIAECPFYEPEKL